MKPSEAMLKGFAMAGGNQVFGTWIKYDRNQNPIGCCAMGAFVLAKTTLHKQDEASMAFFKATDTTIIGANDDFKMSIPDIAGILASEGY